MTSRDLFNELSNIDDSLIEEAGNVERKEVQPMKKNYLKYMWPFAAIAAGFILIAGGAVSIRFLGDKFGIGPLYNYTADVAIDIAVEVERDTEGAIEIIYVKDFVYFDGNTYLATDEEVIKGELLGEVGQNPEYDTSDYVGCQAYLIEGCKGTLNIAVEKDGKVVRCILHEWGSQPDMAAYMKVYGITGAEDIKSVSLEWDYNSQDNKYMGSAFVDKPEDIAEFYNILSMLLLDEEGYDAILNSISKTDYDAWVESGGNKVYEDESGGQYTAGYSGTTAFKDNTRISIETADGSLEFDYYPKMGYMNRFKATDDLVNWLTEHKNQ